MNRNKTQCWSRQGEVVVARVQSSGGDRGGDGLEPDQRDDSDNAPPIANARAT